MFTVTRDDDPRRQEIIITHDDGRWITTAEGKALVLNNMAEARALVEALMEVTMTLAMTYLEEDEDA